MHQEPHPFAGKTVTVKHGHFEGVEYRIEDWQDRLMGKSWMVCDGNPACMIYAVRTGTQDFQVPMNNEVVYGKIGAFGHLIHVNELGLGGVR